MSVETAINNYYLLKKKYYSKYNSNKSKIIKSDASTKEKRIRLSKYQNKCINCKRPVGSIFTKNNNILIAKCGDETSPCKLDIQINVGLYNNLNTIYKTIQNDIELAKKIIINIKLKLLYNIETEESIETEFIDMKEKYQLLISAFEKIIEIIKYKNMVEIDGIASSEKVDKKKVINLNTIKIKNVIRNIKELIDNFQKETILDRKMAYLDETIDLYINNLQVLLAKQRELNFEVCTIIEDKEQYHLIQKKQLYENMEFIIEEPQIISNKI